MRYPVAIHKDPDSDYGVSVPDLPGCTSAGSTIDEALVMAKEAILGHIEVMAEQGYAIPESGSIEQHRTDPDYRDALAWAVVEVDPANLPGRSQRINISLNERLLDVLDQYAQHHHDTRSGVIQRAISDYIESHRKRSA